MDDSLDPRFLQQNDATKIEDDLFGGDIQPKVEDRVKNEFHGHDEEMEDLFGDEDAVVEPAKEKSPTPAVSTREESEALSASELRHRQEMEYEEDEGQDENVVELKHAVLSIPNIPIPKSSDGNYWVIRMPNFVKMDPKPFHPDTYTGPEPSSDGVYEREKSLSIKLETENTIRWRWTKDEFGQDTRQSNGRIIRWSDGTLSLLLGKELFDVNQTYEGPPRQGSQIQSQNQSQGSSQQPSGGRGSGLTYLVAQHKRSGILQTEVPITGHMTLRPTSMQSETHRRLARAVGQKHSRVTRLKLADASMEREAQEAQKSAQKKPRRSRVGARENGELGGSTRKRRTGYGRRRESVWSDEEPEAGAYEETDDEDEGDYDASPRKRRSHGDGRRDADTKRGAGEYQTDDFLVADSSEGEDDFDGSPKRGHKSKKHRRRSEDNEGEADELDKLDKKIAQQQEERRRRKQAPEAKEERGSAEPAETQKSSEVEMDMDMDIESEEEEEEFNIRRTGTGSRKKRAIALDNDEDE